MMSIVESNMRDWLTQTVCQSFRYIDDGEASKAGRLFAKNATMIFGPGSPTPGKLNRAEIEQFLCKREKVQGVKSRHVLTNFLLCKHPEDRIEVRSTMLLFRGEGSLPPANVTFVADLFDVFSREGDQWLIEQRTIIPAFA